MNVKKKRMPTDKRNMKMKFEYFIIQSETSYDYKKKNQRKKNRIILNI